MPFCSLDFFSTGLAITRVSNITQPKVSIILDYLSMPVLLGLVPSEAMIHSIAKLAPKIVGTILWS